MQKVSDIDFALARMLLDSVLNKEGRITYKELANQLTAKLGRKVDAHCDLPDPLGRVSDLCFDLGLPLLSVNVIYSDAKGDAERVAEGFYAKACELRPQYRTMTPVQAWKTELERMRNCTEWDKLNTYLSKVER